MLLALTFHIVGVRTLSRISIFIVCSTLSENRLPCPGSFAWFYIAIPRRVLSRSAAMRRSGQVPSSELWLAKENEGLMRGDRAENGIPCPRISCFPVVFDFQFECSSIHTGRPDESRIVLGSRPVANMDLSAPDENRRGSRRLLGAIDRILYSGVKPGVISVIFIYCALISAESHTVIGTVSCSLSYQAFDY